MAVPKEKSAEAMPVFIEEKMPPIPPISPEDAFGGPHTTLEPDNDVPF